MGVRVLLIFNIDAMGEAKYEKKDLRRSVFPIDDKSRVEKKRVFCLGRKGENPEWKPLYWHFGIRRESNHNLSSLNTDHFFQQAVFVGRLYPKTQNKPELLFSRKF